MDIFLIRPSIELKEEALNYRQDHFDNGEMTINGSELFDRIESYEDWLNAITNNSNPLTINPNCVLTDTYFAVNKNHKIVGIIDLRHTLNEHFKNFGHCGYSVRPSERNKGYATEMLRLILLVAKIAGMNELQLSVERNNVPSVKTIIKNGGKYNRSFDYKGTEADVYKITF